MSRIRIYNFIIKVRPNNGSPPYRRYVSLHESEAIAKAESEWLRTGKDHYVCDYEGRCIRKFSGPVMKRTAIAI